MAKLGLQITPRRRAVVIAYRNAANPVSYRKIHKLTGIPVSTANDIWIHAVTNARKARIGKDESLEAPFSIIELVSAKILDPNSRSGRPQALSTVEKDSLVTLVRRDFTTRRMTLVDLQREAGLSHVCITTIFNALGERGLGAYREQFKFILNPISKLKRLVS